LYEDKQFPNQKLAALVASKVYYHLGEYEDSLSFALGAEELFDLNTKTEYVETIIGINFLTLAKAIDKYIELQNENLDGSSKSIDSRLLNVVQRMFERCFSSKQYHQVKLIYFRQLVLRWSHSAWTC
jgi:26S proteasome regulatory subunit N2